MTKAIYARLHRQAASGLDQQMQIYAAQLSAAREHASHAAAGRAEAIAALDTARCEFAAALAAAEERMKELERNNEATEKELHFCRRRVLELEYVFLSTNLCTLYNPCKLFYWATTVRR